MASRAQWTIEEIDRLVARERALTSPRGPAEQDMDPSKKEALRDASRALEAIGAPYALIGGVAVGVHSDRARAEVSCGIDGNAAIARAEVDHEVVLRGVGQLEHAVDHALRRRDPHDVLALLAHLGLEIVGLRRLGEGGEGAAQREREGGPQEAKRVHQPDPRLLQLELRAVHAPAVLPAAGAERHFLAAHAPLQREGLALGLQRA